MPRILAVLLILPILVACDPLTPVPFTVDAHNDSPRNISVDFILQGEERIGPVRVADQFHVELLISCNINEPTSPCDTDADVAINAVLAGTNASLSPTINCRFSQYAPNTVVYFETGGQGLIRCNGGGRPSWQKSAPLP